MTRAEQQVLNKVTIEYEAGDKFGDSIRVNGITIMECLGYSEFLKMNVGELIKWYKEAEEIEGKLWSK